VLCSELLTAYVAERPLGNILTDEQIGRSLKKAIRFYCGYATMRNAPSDFEKAQAEAISAGLTPPDFPEFGQGIHTPVDSTNTFIGAQDFDLTPSEYALIRPLFDLYCELENAMGMEASRSTGIEQYGRATSEIQAEITQQEELLPKRAFYQAVVTV